MANCYRCSRTLHEYEEDIGICGQCRISDALWEGREEVKILDAINRDLKQRLELIAYMADASTNFNYEAILIVATRPLSEWADWYKGMVRWKEANLHCGGTHLCEAIE